MNQTNNPSAKRETFMKTTNQTKPMKLTHTTLKSLVLLLAVFCASALISTAQTPPLRSYAISGVDNTRSFTPALGWTYATNSFSGTLAFPSPTNALLTKIYADGSSTTRELILGWYFDPAAPAQGGTAVEVPDPNDPVIKRTTYNLSLSFDGVQQATSGNFLTRAWMSVIAGRYEWVNVAYGDFTGQAASPLGSYSVAGSESVGRKTCTYSGTFSLTSPTTGTLVKSYANGTSLTVNLAIDPPVDSSVAVQDVTATQIENRPGQRTSYGINLQLNGTLYSVTSVYSTTQKLGRRTRTVSTGVFSGSQP